MAEVKRDGAQTSFENSIKAAWEKNNDGKTPVPLDVNGVELKVIDTPEEGTSPSSEPEKVAVQPEKKNVTPVTSENKPEKPAITEEDYNNFFKEKKGKTFEEYENELKTTVAEEIKKTVKPTFKSKFTEGLVNWEEKGGSREEYLKIHSTDWTKVGADDLLKLELKKQYEGLSDEQLNVLFDDTYRTDPEKYVDLTPQQIEVAKIKKETDAAKIRKELIAQQEAATDPQTHIEAEKKKQLDAEKQRVWESVVEKSLQDFSSLDGKIKTTTGLEVDYKYDLNKEQKSELLNVLKKPDTIFSKYLNKDGKVDTKRMERDFAILANFDAIIENVASAAEAKFVQTNLKNTDFNTKYGKAPAVNKNVDEQASQTVRKHLHIN